MEVEPAEMDDHELGLGLVPGPPRSGLEPADGQVAAASAPHLQVQRLEVERVDALLPARRRAAGRSG